MARRVNIMQAEVNKNEVVKKHPSKIQYLLGLW